MSMGQEYLKRNIIKNERKKIYMGLLLIINIELFSILMLSIRNEIMLMTFLGLMLCIGSYIIFEIQESQTLLNDYYNMICGNQSGNEYLGFKVIFESDQGSILRRFRKFSIWENAEDGDKTDIEEYAEILGILSKMIERSDDWNVRNVEEKKVRKGEIRWHKGLWV